MPDSTSSLTAPAVPTTTISSYWSARCASSALVSPTAAISLPGPVTSRSKPGSSAGKACSSEARAATRSFTHTFSQWGRLEPDEGGPVTLQQQIAEDLGVKPEIDPAAEAETRIAFLVDYLHASRAKGFVLGISGGQD